MPVGLRALLDRSPRPGVDRPDARSPLLRLRGSGPARQEAAPGMTVSARPILTASHVSKLYQPSRLFGVGGGAVVRAVDDVSLEVRAGETSASSARAAAASRPWGGCCSADRADESDRSTSTGSTWPRPSLGPTASCAAPGADHLPGPVFVARSGFRIRDILWEGLRQVPRRGPANRRRPGRPG